MGRKADTETRVLAEDLTVTLQMKVKVIPYINDPDLKKEQVKKLH